MPNVSCLILFVIHAQNLKIIKPLFYQSTTKMTYQDVVKGAAIFLCVDAMFPVFSILCAGVFLCVSFFKKLALASLIVDCGSCFPF